MKEGPMTVEQFKALATLMRMSGGSQAYQTAELVFVSGLAIASAAEQVGTTYNAAHQATKRVENALALAKKATGSSEK